MAEQYEMNMGCDNCGAGSTRLFDKGTQCKSPTFNAKDDYYDCPLCGCKKAKALKLVTLEPKTAKGK
jgi:hypothetical protein